MEMKETRGNGDDEKDKVQQNYDESSSRKTTLGYKNKLLAKKE